MNKVFPEIKLIILRVHDEPTVVEECLEAGAAGFVLKRTTANDLAFAVEAVWQGKQYISPSVRGYSRALQ